MMRSLSFLVSASAAVLLGAGFLPSLKADEWNKQTVVTFNEPVEIPGQVLPAGTYVFKLADTTADRNVVQIFNKRQDTQRSLPFRITAWNLRAKR